MRFQDELVTSFRSITQVEPRRYLIRQMADLPVTFDFFEVTDALAGEERRADSALWPLAASALSALLPRALPARYGFDPRRDLLAALVEPGKGADRAAPAASWISIMPAAAPGRGMTNEVWIGAGCHLLEECLEPLLAAAKSGDTARRAAAFRALPRFLHHRARNELKELAPRDRLAAVALALTGDPEAEPALLEVARAESPPPELIALLGRYASRDAARELKRLLTSREVTLRIAAAQALEGFADHDPVDLARPLMRAGESRWPLVHLADSLGRAGGPDAVPPLIDLYNMTPDPLAQVAIVRSIANLGGQRAAPFLLSLLDGAADPVKAVAVEGLVQVRMPREELSPRLPPLLESSYARLSANALVALAEIDAGETAKRLVNWLKSRDESLRLEGAFILGYMRTPAGQKVTAKLARGDPSPVVRMEHLRALSKYPPAESASLLEASLTDADARVRSRALRLWIRAFPMQPRDLTARLLELMRKETDPGARATAVECLGLVGQPEAHAALVEELASPEPSVVAAAIGAIAASGASALAPEVTRRVGTASTSTSPALRARGAVALWSLGDLSARQQLVQLLGGDEEELSAGAEALEEICLLLPSLPASPRHTALAALLTTHVRTPAYEAFSRERLGIKPAVRVSARAYKDAEQAEAPPPERNDTKATAQALEELERSGTLAEIASQGSLMIQKIVRLPLDLPEVRGLSAWSPKRKAAALVVAVCATLALALTLTRSGPGGSSPQRPPVLEVATIAAGKVAVLGVTGNAKGGAPGQLAPLSRGQLVPVPASLTTEHLSRLTVAASLGQNRVQLESDSALTIRAVTPGKQPASYSVVMADLTGTALLSFSTGDPHVVLELGSTRLEAQQLVAHVSVHGKQGELSVEFGKATVTRPDGPHTVSAPERLSWDVP